MAKLDVATVLQLIRQILDRTSREESVALCTVVRTRGSTPQEHGATMLVTQDGATLGTLGGGCVEAEVRMRALRLLQSRSSTLLTFKLDHDYGWDDGLVCGGVMDIAVQVIDPSAGAESWRAAHDALVSRRSTRLTIRVPDENGRVDAFEHVLTPSPTLVIAGGGHVGLALGDLARKLDFDLVVIDDRPDYASSERFPGARCIVGEIERELSQIPIDEHTYIVIVTRGHRHDGRALHAVVGSRAKYVGLIGSKRKILTIFQDLHRQDVPREQLLKVHAPIGLDIGAVTPSEIALSIATELVAVRRGVGDQPAAPMRIAPELLDRALREPTDDPV